ncbi:hypothetical protein [Pseudomonas putida]|nr:hypothetical protein [Pseudomonas putida]
MTIVKNIIARAEHPFENLEVTPILDAANANLSKFKARSVISTLRYLECFLQITNQKLSYQDLESSSSDEILATFCGALASIKFAALGKSGLASAISRLSNTVNAIRRLSGSAAFLEFSNPQCNPLIPIYRDTFEQLNLDEHKVWYWSGWECTNAAEKTINLPLAKIYLCYGRDFTTLLYEICKTFLAGHRTCNIYFVELFRRYLYIEPEKFTAIDFRNPDRTTCFFDSLFRYHYQASIEKGRRHDSVIAAWKYHVVPFLKHQLVPNGLFALPSSIVTPPAVEFSGRNKHLIERSNGVVKANTFVDIPLHISDDEAFRELKARILFCHSAAIQWCTEITNETQEAYDNYKSLAALGKPIMTGTRLHEETNAWLASSRNPEQLQNLAATLQKHGYRELGRVLKISNIAHGPVAKNLGLPTTEVLTAICIKLISVDPRITPSFLTSVEIYDKNGNFRGVDSGDVVEYLHGHKDRRGPARSEIRILLNDESKKIVQLLINITAPLRDHLKDGWDPLWRTLLITSQRHVALPSKFGLKAKTDDSRVNRIIEHLKSNHDLAAWTTEELKNFARAILCPSRMRTTTGVVKFLETGSLHAMAKALGHTSFNPRTLSSYLPTSILHFFRDRWVRVFQTGVIVQAMKTSHHLLKAANFSSSQELAQFLENHALPHQEPLSPREIRKNDNSKLIIAINLPIARALHSLKDQKLKNTISESLEHWVEFYNHLLAYLERDPDNNLEVLDIIRAARSLDPITLPDT